MKPPRKNSPRAPARGAKPSPSKLDALIAEAIVDCYSEDEERTGLFTMLDDHIEVPFETRVLDVEVTVERLDLTEAGEIVAICRRGKARQAVPVLDLPLPQPPPHGTEWIEAYRRWAGRRQDS